MNLELLDQAILYIDDSIVVFNKPSAWSLHRGEDRDGPFLLNTARKLLGGWLYPPHRLDRATSGVLVMARTSAANRSIGWQFEERSVEKQYLAWVKGRFPAEIDLDYPLRINQESQERESASTHFICLRNSEMGSLVLALPKEGRRHQIRRHLKHVHHPILGDVRYGKKLYNQPLRDSVGLLRLGLHAHSLSFRHPLSGAALQFMAPLDPSLAEPAALMDLLPDQDMISQALSKVSYASRA